MCSFITDVLMFGVCGFSSSLMCSCWACVGFFITDVLMLADQRRQTFQNQGGNHRSRKTRRQHMKDSCAGLHSSLKRRKRRIWSLSSNCSESGSRGR